MAGRFDNIHPGLTCDYAREILGKSPEELDSKSDFYMAAGHLLNCPGPETEKALIGLLETSKSDQSISIAKRKAVETLARLGSYSAMTSIGTCLWSDDQYLIENSVWALQKLRCDDQKLIRKMIDLLSDSISNQRVIIQCLASLGVRECLELVESLQDSESPGVSGAAISAVAQLRDDHSRVSEIVDSLILPNQMDRQCAIQDLIDAGALKFLPSVVVAPVSAAFRMRACRHLIKFTKNISENSSYLSMIEIVLKDNPATINIVHEYDETPSLEFLVRDLFHTDFSRCYLALKNLSERCICAKDLVQLLVKVWEEEAYNDYGAHYFVMKLLGSRCDWPESELAWINSLLWSEAVNLRPQFQKSRAAAISSYFHLFAHNLFDACSHFLDQSVSSLWDCRYVCIDAIYKSKSIDHETRRDLLQQFLDDDDDFVLAKVQECISKLSLAG